MPDQTVTLSDNDWQIVRAALYELPIKVGLMTLQRFEAALAQPALAASEHNRAVPRIVGDDHAS